MQTGKKLSAWAEDRLEATRLHLSRPDALMHLAGFGLIAGVLAGGVIVVFRLLVERTQASFLPGGHPENYEGLPLWLLLILPIAGGFLIGLIFRRYSRGDHVLGVAKVMESMAYRQGHLSLRGFLLQFVGAALAIVSGHSVGREGPHIYLGAASGSLLGQRLSLPNNSIRTLVACGTAAGIAASFNTPLAGVIFALEVVMMEYTLASFIPVILAAVSATSVSVLALGSDPAFEVPAMSLAALSELPIVLVLGVIVGGSSAIFISLIQLFAKYSQKLAFWWRTTLAGLIVGVCGMLVPEVMGIGYDTVNSALLGTLSVGVLSAMVLLKLVATSASVGMGIPGGMIGPALFMGAILGSMTGVVANVLFPETQSSVGFFALLGMGAMMGASLQAPLAALTAMMELTHSPGIILPGMVTIVIAGLTSSEIFRKESLFIAMLKANGMDYKTDPVLQALRRVGVAHVMNRNFVRQDKLLVAETAKNLLAGEPDWLLIDDGASRYLMPAVDLARHVEDATDEKIDLSAIPARRYQSAPIDLQATLQEALEAMKKAGAEAMYVERVTAPGIKRIYGVLTKDQIESAYRY